MGLSSFQRSCCNLMKSNILLQAEEDQLVKWGKFKDLPLLEAARSHHCAYHSIKGDMIK